MYPTGPKYASLFRRPVRVSAMNGTPREERVGTGNTCGSRSWIARRHFGTDGLARTNLATLDRRARLAYVHPKSKPIHTRMIDQFVGGSVTDSTRRRSAYLPLGRIDAIRVGSDPEVPEIGHRVVHVGILVARHKVHWMLDPLILAELLDIEVSLHTPILHDLGLCVSIKMTLDTSES